MWINKIIKTIKMSEELTKNLLKSYYGFGEIKQKNATNFLATHMGFDYLYFDDKIVSNDSNDCLTTNNLDRINLHDKIDVKNDKNQFIGDHLKRSWRALDDDTNLIVNHEYDNEPQNTPKIKNLDDNNTKNLKLNYPCETDNRDDSASDISSMSMKKKTKKKQKKKLPDAVLSTPVVEKKLPIITNQFCDMTNSHLEEFPQYFLNKIANIKMIYLESNLLSELPSDFFDILRHLQWFDIRNNRLKSLPSSIKNHSCLETIMLQGNLFEKLPLELGLIPKLKTLHTSGNPLSYPATYILNKGFSRIIHFLREEWNKLNPNEQVFSPSAGSKMIKSSSTDFSNNLTTISKLSSGSSKQLKTTSSVSTLTLSSKKKKLTTREKSRNYKPSNRYESLSMNEWHLLELNNKKNKINDLEEHLKNTSPSSHQDDIINYQQIKIKINELNIDKKKTIANTSGSLCSSTRDIGVFINLDSFDNEKLNYCGKGGFRLPKIVNKNFSRDCPRLEDVKVKKRVYDIMTNNRIMTKIRPMRLDDPDWTLAFIETYLEGINKPAEWCRKIHNEEFLEEKLRWILKVKEILNEQSRVLQQNKNQDALNLWRMKRKNIDKNIEKASSRTEEDIPFAIDIRDMPFLKNHKNKKLIDKKKASFLKNSDEIDTKMKEIFESLKLSENRDETIKNQGPDLHLNILKSKIKKIEELYSEIQKLKRFNTTTISKNYNGPNIQTKTVVYKLPPSMII